MKITRLCFLLLVSFCVTVIVNAQDAKKPVIAKDETKPSPVLKIQEAQPLKQATPPALTETASPLKKDENNTRAKPSVPPGVKPPETKPVEVVAPVIIPPVIKNH